MRAVMCWVVLVFVVLAAACGGAGTKTKDDVPAKGEDVKSGPPTNSQPNEASEPGSLSHKADLNKCLTDFEALAGWCEKSCKEIAAEHNANAIRGEELNKQRTEQFRSATVGKQFRWRLQLRGVGTDGSAWFKSYHCIERQAESQGRKFNYDDIYLTAKWKKSENFRGSDWTADPCYILDGVPKEKLRSLTNGEYVFISGTIAEANKVSVGGPFSVETRSAKIE